MLRPEQQPTGVGLYLRGLSPEIHGTPEVAARRAADAGVSFVAILAAWFDRHNGVDRQMMSNGRDGALIARYADAFAAAGVHPWIWGFPRGGFEEPYVARLRAVSDVAESVVGWLHDPEVFYKWDRSGRSDSDTTMRGQPEYSAAARPDGTREAREAQAASLMALTLDALTEALGLGITSYGMAQYHPNFPWEVFGGVGWGSPQLYSVDGAQVRAGLAAWRNLGWSHLVPSVPSFGPNSGDGLRRHLGRFDGLVDGLIFWSWRQTSRAEWRVISEVADRLARRPEMG